MTKKSLSSKKDAETEILEQLILCSKKVGAEVNGNSVTFSKDALLDFFFFLLKSQSILTEAQQKSEIDCDMLNELPLEIFYRA